MINKRAMKNMENSNIPSQVTGKKLDITEERTYRTSEEAVAAFDRARERLYAINQWQDFAGTASATFELVNALGQVLSRPPQVGDYVKVDIPGPGSLVGKGYDWVRVTQLEDRREDRYVQLSLQPSMPPEILRDRDEVAHFFKPIASTNIEVQLTGLTLHVNYYGRNEETNLASESLIENARNAFIGLGAKIGLSYPQWKRLVEGILGD
ncbi:hypothetical protein [Sphingobacterium paludis]|nr:hypothetical protein [Sphingobacterium paludis]